MNGLETEILFQELDPESKLICAFLVSRNIGDFAEQLLTAAAVKENLEGYRLAVFYNQDRPYKSGIVSLCPSVDIEMPGPSGQHFPINMFDIYSGRVAFDDAKLDAHDIHKSTIILAGNSLPSMCLPNFSHVPRLRFSVSERQHREAEEQREAAKAQRQEAAKNTKRITKAQQTAFGRLGLYNGAIDGIAGPKTNQALKR